MIKIKYNINPSRFVPTENMYVDYLGVVRFNSKWSESRVLEFVKQGKNKHTYSMIKLTVKTND